MQTYHAAISLLAESWTALQFWYWAAAYTSALFLFGHFVANLFNNSQLTRATAYCNNCGKVLIVLVSETKRYGGIDHVGKGNLTTTVVKSDGNNKCPRCGSGRELVSYNVFYAVLAAFLALFGRFGFFGKTPLWGHFVLTLALSVLHKFSLTTYAVVFDLLFFTYSLTANPLLIERLIGIGNFLGIVKTNASVTQMLGSIPAMTAVRFLQTQQVSGEACTFAALKSVCQKHRVIISDREAHKFFQVTDKLGITSKQGGEEHNTRIVVAETVDEIERELLKFARSTNGVLDPSKALRINNFLEHTHSPEEEGEEEDDPLRRTGEKCP